MIHADFIVKRNALFASLDSASNELKGTTLDQSKWCGIVSVRENAVGERELVYRNNRIKHMGTSQSPERTLKHLRGKESIFKKPELPISKCLKPRKIPDYQINPHKWKKYSLSDVDISEQTNTAAAFTFLRQMDEQREDSQYDMEALNDNSSNEHKIEFKKISKIQRNLKVLEEQDEVDSQLDVPKLKGTKLIMPEYAVGQKSRSNYKRNMKTLLCKKDKDKKNKIIVGQLSLAHLQEVDDEMDKDI